MKSFLLSVLLLSAASAARCADPSPTPSPSASPALAPNVPEEVRPFAQEAKDFYDRGKYHEAERSYERALLRAPNNVFILSNLGVVLFKLGKLKGSEAAFKKAIAAAPEDTFSRTTLGVVYYQEARYDDAIGQLKKAREIDPGNAQLQGVERELRKAIELDRTKYPAGDYLTPLEQERLQEQIW